MKGKIYRAVTFAQLLLPVVFIWKHLHWSTLRRIYSTFFPIPPPILPYTHTRSSLYPHPFSHKHASPILHLAAPILHGATPILHWATLNLTEPQYFSTEPCPFSTEPHPLATEPHSLDIVPRHSPINPNLSQINPNLSPLSQTHFLMTDWAIHLGRPFVFF